VKPPRTKKQLRSFLGLVSFFRMYVHRYATIAYPLTELLANTKPDRLDWTSEQQEAFDTLKRALMTKPVLRPPDNKKPYLIMADSSKLALAGILMQPSGTDDSSANHVVAYASRKLLERETHYPVIEREILAIVFSLQKFRQYILGGPVLRVYSDHKPLAWLNSLVKHSPRLARWTLLLSEYNVTTTYVPGRNQIADSLTRLD